MNTDSSQVDRVLSTTRAVRRRLDLERTVDNQLLLDCIDLAEQAPTGGNLGSRRWIIVRDPPVKAQLGELYRDADLESLGGRTRLRFSYTIGAGRSGTTMAIHANPGKEAHLLRRRLNEVQANMQNTINGIKDLAEQSSAR